MPLPDDALLVRGLPFDRNSFEGSVRRNFKKDGVHGLSVFGIAGVTPSEIVRRSRDAELDLYGEMIRVTTAGAVRRAGLGLENDFAWHHLIVFSAKPTPADWRTIDGLFGPERPAILEGE